MPKLMTRSLSTLGCRTVDQPFLDEILNPNPADDVLRWLADPKGVQAEKGEGWNTFVASSRARYRIDWTKGVLEGAPVVLAASRIFFYCCISHSRGRHRSEIRKQIGGFEEIRTSARTIVSGGDKILKRAQLMEDEITKRIGNLTGQVERLRSATSDGKV